MISFYDTFLTPSLISRRFGQERFVHHIGGASESDIQRVLNRLETAVQMPHGGGSGVDWKTLVQVIVDRYQDRVEMVQFLPITSYAAAVLASLCRSLGSESGVDDLLLGGSDIQTMCDVTYFVHCFFPSSDF